MSVVAALVIVAIIGREDDREGRGDRIDALDACQRYGKRTGHPAQLNMGDCFTHACATTTATTLLYKGDDFAHRDLR